MVLYLSFGPINPQYLAERQIFSNSYLTFLPKLDVDGEYADPIHVQFVKEVWSEDQWQMYAESNLAPELLLPLLRGISKAVGCPGSWYRVVDKVTFGGIDSD